MAKKTYGDPRVNQLFAQAIDLYNRKNHDYAENADPMSNFRKSEIFGVPSRLGVLIRINDKISRLSQITKKQAKVPGETVKDTLLDVANYALIAAVLYEEVNERPSRP